MKYQEGEYYAARIAASCRLIFTWHRAANLDNIRSMRQQRWLRIIPVALIMYTISYVDRTNVSMALDPKISSLMHDLLMDDRMKGQAANFSSVTFYCKWPAAIWPESGARKSAGQPLPGFLGSVRRGLWPGEDILSI